MVSYIFRWLKAIGEWFKEEYQLVVQPMDIKSERHVYEHKTSLVRLQFIVLGTFTFLMVCTFMIVNPEGKRLIWQNWRALFFTLILVLSVSAVATVAIYRTPRANMISCLFMCCAHIFWLESIFHLFEVDASKVAMSMNMVIYMVLFWGFCFQHLSALLLNQPALLQVSVSLVAKYFLIFRVARFFSMNALPWLLGKSIFLSLFHSLFLYSCKKGETIAVTQLLLRKKDVDEMVTLLGSISTSTAYVVRPTSNTLSQEEKIQLNGPSSKEEMQGTPILAKSRSDAIKTILLNSATVETYPCSKGLNPIDICGLIDSLEEMEFNRSSRFTTNKLWRQESLNEAPSSPENDLNPQMAAILKQAHEVQLNNRTFFEIVIEFYNLMLEGKCTQFPLKFCFKDVSSKNFLYLDDYKLFDVDLMFVDYENDPAIVIVIRDNLDRSLLDRLEEQSHGIDMALSELTHDMRAPLHAILGYSENLLYKLSDNPKLCREMFAYAKKISANCEHLSILVNDILDSTRLDLGKFNLNCSIFDLVSLVRECIEITRTVHDSGCVEFMYKGPRILEVYNDCHRLKRILLNLLANSIKFTDLGMIKVEIEDRHKLVFIRVTDTGSGIPKPMIKYLFRRFSSGKPNTAKFGLQSREGIGLGLATTRELVNRLGPARKINVRSSPGKGSSFSFVIFSNQLEAEEVRKDLKTRPLLDIDDPPQLLSDQSYVSSPSHKEFQSPRLRENSKKSNQGLSSPTEDLIPALPPSDAISMKVELRKQKTPPSSPSSSKKIFGRKCLSNPPQKIRIMKTRNIDEVEEESELHCQPTDRRLLQLEELEKSISDPTTNTPPKTIQIHKIFEISPTDNKISFRCKWSEQRATPQAINILILDDDSFNRDILYMYLTRYFREREFRHQHSVVSTPTVRIDVQQSYSSAIEFLRLKASQSIFYSLVITDYHLSDEKTGVDFVRKTKELYCEMCHLFPAFILVSGTSLSDKHEIAMFFKCFLKPFSYDQFSSELDKWVHSYLDMDLTIRPS